MTMPAATSRLTLPLALTIALFTVACQPETDRDAPAPTAPATTEPAPTPAPADATTATETFHWQCGEVGVASTYIDDAQSVTLAFSGRELELPIAVSASGARYADAAGNEFWTKGDSGTLALADEAGSETAKRECTRSERPSPWFQAAERGVGFRAVGNEPGWFVEVDRGETRRCAPRWTTANARSNLPGPSNWTVTHRAFPATPPMAPKCCSPSNVNPVATT